MKNQDFSKGERDRFKNTDGKSRFPRNYKFFHQVMFKGRRKQRWEGNCQNSGIFQRVRTGFWDNGEGSAMENQYFNGNIPLKNDGIDTGG